MITFRVGWNDARRVGVVEVLRDGQLMAVIYPHEDGIHLVSKYLPSSDPRAAVEVPSESLIPIPSLLIRLLP